MELNQHEPLRLDFLVCEHGKNGTMWWIDGNCVSPFCGASWQLELKYLHCQDVYNKKAVVCEKCRFSLS